MSLQLDVEMAVDQDEFHWAMVKHLGLTYDQVESQMVEIGFFKGNGDIVFNVHYPEDDIINPVGVAMHEYMRHHNYGSIRVYGDH